MQTSTWSAVAPAMNCSLEFSQFDHDELPQPHAGTPPADTSGSRRPYTHVFCVIGASKAAGARRMAGRDDTCSECSRVELNRVDAALYAGFIPCAKSQESRWCIHLQIERRYAIRLGYKYALGMTRRTRLMRTIASDGPLSPTRQREIGRPRA